MNIRKFFKRPKKESEELPWDERLRDARVESLRNKTAAADEIIGMMKDFRVERRTCLVPFPGQERRHE